MRRVHPPSPALRASPILAIEAERQDFSPTPAHSRRSSALVVVQRPRYSGFQRGRADLPARRQSHFSRFRGLGSSPKPVLLPPFQSGRTAMQDSPHQPITTSRKGIGAKNIRNRALSPDRKKGHRGGSNRRFLPILLISKIVKLALGAVSFAIVPRQDAANARAANFNAPAMTPA